MHTYMERENRDRDIETESERWRDGETQREHVCFIPERDPGYKSIKWTKVQCGKPRGFPWGCYQEYV